MNKINKWHDDTGKVIKETLTVLAEAVTGIAATDRKDLSLSVGQILQSLRKGQFLSKLSEEWDSYREKGRIKDDYLETEQHIACFQELLNFLDNDSPDDIRFEAMKKVFLVTAFETISDRNSPLPYECLKLCRSLSSGEIIVLGSIHAMQTSATVRETARKVGGNWLKRLAEISNLQHAELVELHRTELVKKGLLNATQPPSYLSGLGKEICHYILSYETDESEK